MAAVGMRISMTMARPRPSIFGSKDWQRIPSSTMESCARTWGCWCAGKTSTIRLMVETAELVCRVAKVKWPVSAMRRADSIVSRSRISPMSTTSGSSRGAERVRERVRIGVHFALIDQALFVVMQEFDGVFNGDHVLFMLVIDFVEHGGEGGGFTGTGGAGDEHQAARFITQAANDGGEAEVVEGFDFPWNGTEDGGDCSALMEDVAAEARQAFQTEGKIEFEIFL